MDHQTQEYLRNLQVSATGGRPAGNTRITEEEDPTKLMQILLIEWSKNFVRKLENFPSSKLCKEGDVNILWQLLMKKADPKVLDTYGFACIPHVFWNKSMIGFFLLQGCDVNAINEVEDGSTALHHAVRFMWERDADVVQFLLEKGAKPAIRDKKRKIPLLYLPRSILTSNQPQNLEIFEELLEVRGTSQSRDYTNGDTVLHRAVLNLDCKTLEEILQNFDGNVDVRSGEKELQKTPLMIAVVNGKYDNCRLLAQKGADLNVQDSNGYTALHYSIYNNDSDCRNLLMKNNADPNIRSNSGRDVYDLACLLERDFTTERAEPSKLIQICEMKGAIAIIKEGNYEEGLKEWAKAFNMCNPPSFEQRFNYELATKEPRSYEIKLDLYRAAIRTMDKVSTGTSKLWNVLFAAFYGLLRSNDISDDELTEILSFISDKMNSFNGEDFVSMEDIDLMSFRNFIEKLYDKEFSSNYTRVILNAAKFAISCFSKWIQRAGSSRIKDLGCVYYQMCIILKRIQIQSCDDLIKSIAELDPIDCFTGNSLFHSACQNWDRELVEDLIHFGAANVRMTNDDEKTPIQLISSAIFKDEENLRVIKMMIEMGSPLNVTNVEGDVIEHLVEPDNQL